MARLSLATFSSPWLVSPYVECHCQEVFEYILLIWFRLFLVDFSSRTEVESISSSRRLDGEINFRKKSPSHFSGPRRIWRRYEARRKGLNGLMTSQLLFLTCSLPLDRPTVQSLALRNLRVTPTQRTAATTIPTATMPPHMSSRHPPQLHTITPQRMSAASWAATRNQISPPSDTKIPSLLRMMNWKQIYSRRSRP